jgi:hypothetical protein
MSLSSRTLFKIDGYENRSLRRGLWEAKMEASRLVLLCSGPGWRATKEPIEQKQ